MSEVEFYDKRDPIAYVQPLYKRAKEWWDSISPRIREQWDMYMANDAYINDREKMGYAHLSYPMIHIAIEAIISTVHRAMQAEQNLWVFEPNDRRDVFSKIGSEHLTSAFSNVRADLDYDSKILDMVLATSIFDFAHMKLELQTMPAEPTMGLTLHPEDVGMPKTYPTWNMYAPGSVIFDGSYASDDKIEARFQEDIITYQKLKQRWPKQVGRWILKHERPIDELEMSVQTSKAGVSDETIYYMYQKRLGEGGAQDQRRGFLLVQCFVNTINSKGEVEPRIIWWLPHVVAEGASGGVHRFGYVLEENAPAFDSVPQPFRTCRSRRLPFTVNGRGTAGLLIPIQRQFSAQVSHEMDLDQLLQSPPVLMREGVWIGRENPSFSANELWSVSDPTDQGLPLNSLVQPMQLQMYNRGYLQDMNQRLQNMGDLISAAVESTTGGQTNDPNKTATAFQGRESGAMNRIMVQFVEHASNLIWLNQMSLRMMREAPGEFLYPPISTFSETLGAPGILTERHLMAAARSRVPALSEYTGKELGKVLWRMVGDGLAQTPIYASSPELQLWWVERMIRAMGVAEPDVQEAMMAANQGVMQANLAAMQGSVPPEVGGGGPPAPPPGVNPRTVTQAGNLGPAVAA